MKQQPRSGAKIRGAEDSRSTNDTVVQPELFSCCWIFRNGSRRPDCSCCSELHHVLKFEYQIYFPDVRCRLCSETCSNYKLQKKRDKNINIQIWNFVDKLAPKRGGWIWNVLSAPRGNSAIKEQLRPILTLPEIGSQMPWSHSAHGDLSADSMDSCDCRTTPL